MRKEMICAKGRDRLIDPLSMVFMRIIFMACISFLLTACSLTGSNDTSGNQLKVDVRNAPKVYMDAETEKYSQAMYHFLVGQLSYLGEDFPGALENFKKASTLSTQPEPELYARLAELFVRSSELEQGLEEISKALKYEPENTSYLLMQAGIFEALKRPREAEPIYLALISKNPELLDPYIILSNFYLENKNNEQALAILQKLIKRVPEEAAAHYYLARAYESKPDLKKARVHMTRAYELKDKNEEIAAELIRILLKDEKVSEVETICKAMLDSNPGNKLALRLLGEMAIGEGRFDDALTHFKVLGTVEEDASETRYKMALIQLERQNFKEAEREFILVLATQPENYRARYYLASIYAGAGRNREAVIELMKIRADSDVFVKSRTFASFIFRQDGNLEEAENAAKEALAVEKDNKKILAYLVLILRDEKKYTEAEALLENALNEDPDNDRLLFNYSVISHDLGRKAKALEIMERVIAINPINADALNFVAYELAENGKELERAKKLIEQALEIKANDGYFLDTLGWIYFKKGDFDKAEEILGRAVSLTGGDVVILEHYGDTLVELNKAGAALEVYNNALASGKAASVVDDVDLEVLDRIGKKVRMLSIESKK
ncbi:tetratricopeptide repeat protein [Oligoflexia bacterium]|nr:tetratricopeptide repeat protein [Oligoflexia bacterium]